MTDGIDRDSDRNPNGTFRKGNRSARKTGLYARCGLTTGERNKCARLRKHLRQAGLPSDVISALAVQWVAAERVIAAFMRIADDREMLAAWPTAERAAAVQRAVLRRRDRALGLLDGDEDGEEPIYRQIERLRSDRERGLGGDL